MQFHGKNNNFQANVVDRSKVNDQTLWTAKKVYNAAVHPDTGDIVPGPFRMVCILF